MKKETIRTLVCAAILLLLFVGCAIWLWDYILALGTEEGRGELKELISGLGVGGWFVTLGIQVLQVIVAILPGEPVELMLGFMWGPWLGTFTCLLGILLGTTVVYFMVRLLGRPFAHLVVGESDAKRYKFLTDPVKLDTTVFILFFIPGTPKDVLTYLVPLTGINPIKYFLISTVARIPSVVTSTVLGDSILRGDYALAVAVFILTAALSVGGIVLGSRYVKYKQGKQVTIPEQVIEAEKLDTPCDVLEISEATETGGEPSGKQ